MANILIIAEHSKGRLKKATLSAITLAQNLLGKLGGTIDALLLGTGVEAVAQELSAFGLSTVLVGDSPALEKYIADVYATAAQDLMQGRNYEYVLAATSAYTKDLMPRLATRFRAGMASDVSGLDLSGPLPLFARPVWAGNAIAWVSVETPVKFLTVRATEFEPAKAGGTSAILRLPVTVDPSRSGVRYVEFQETLSSRPELTEARVVVSGGRGCKGADGFKLLEQLADHLGAAIGASRAAVDAGWVPNDLQVGQTGKIVAPELYIAIGMSGAIQHLAGMKGSKVIVAVNKDEEAPIFQVADYGLVADLFKAVPELTASLK